MASHVNIGHARKSIDRRRLKSARALVFLFGLGIAVLRFQQRAGGKMRFGVIALEASCLSVSLEGCVRLGSLKDVPQGQPGTGLPFLSMRIGLELGRGP